MAVKRVLPVDRDGNPINAATEEAVIWLRRIADLLEPSATQDAAMRQRVSVDVIAAGTNIIGYIGTGSASSTAYSTPMAMPPANAAMGATVHELNYPVDQRWEFVERSRIAAGIQRQSLIFS